MPKNVEMTFEACDLEKLEEYRGQYTKMLIGKFILIKKYMLYKGIEMW
jgi:hypothetical protein